MTDDDTLDFLNRGSRARADASSGGPTKARGSGRTARHGVNLKFTRDEFRALEAVCWTRGRTKQDTLIAALGPLLDEGRAIVARNVYKGVDADDD